MLRPFSCFASCILLVSSPYDTPRRVSPLLLSDGRNKATEKSWCSQEDWALLDGVSSFTVGEGKFKATFWDALAASNVVLRERTPTECAKRIKALSPKARSGGGQPKRLDVWRRLPDGRYMGIDNGRVLHITVSEEGHLAEGTQPHYIESTMGRVYELAPTSDFLAGLVDDAAPPETTEVTEATPLFVPTKGQLATIGALVLAVLAVGAALNGLLPNILTGGDPSAAEVQAEIMSTMNIVMQDMMIENADAQSEVVNAMNAVQSIEAVEAAGVQAEIMNAMGRAAQ